MSMKKIFCMISIITLVIVSMGANYAYATTDNDQTGNLEINARTIFEDIAKLKEIKTVDWIIPNLEIMGIENLSLKRNLITILSNKSSRGWEIQMESEKLYYFTINILDQKKKTLPIPSGKCSMLIDKL